MGARSRGVALWGLMAFAACGGDGAGADDVSLDVSEVEPDAVEVEPDGDAVAEETVEVDDTEVTPDSEVVDTSTGFPADGLVIRILEPGAHGVAESSGASIVISGILFGDASAIVWQAGAQSGSATPTRFWQAGPIALVPGDNRISVTATDGQTSVGDSLVVTYNPAFRFDEPLAVSPSTLWKEEATDVVFNVVLSRATQVDLTRLEVVRVDEGGEVIAVVGGLADDGRLDVSGDEIALDGVFTHTARVNCDGPRFYRARVPVTGATSFAAVSPIIRVECFERLDRASCEAKRAVIDSATAALSGGMSPGEVAASLAQDTMVAEAGVGAEGERVVWVVFADGVLGAAMLPQVGTRGGAGVAARVGEAMLGATPLPLLGKRALVLSPRAAELTADESAEVARRLDVVECPSFEVESGGPLVGEAASLARLRSMSSFGVVTLATHGAELFGTMSPERMRAHRWRHVGPQEVLWSGSPVSCDNLLSAQRECVVTPQAPQGGCPSGSRCLVTRGVASDGGSSGEGVCVDETQEDLRAGRVLMTNLGYAVTPSFFAAWRGRGYPASLVHLGACGSLKSGSLASELYAAGARAISGFSGVVSDGFAEDVALALIEARSLGTVGEVIAERVDPEHGGQWRVFGATNLSLSGSELLNGGFERGLVGWRTSGDGRTVMRFGDVQPVSGKTVGLVSTGLGFSVASGELRQTFCVPAGATRLGFEWKFLSEEFKEWCGTPKFQDRFTATLIDEVGDAHVLLEVKVDDLCGYADGTCAACPSPRACDPMCDGQAGCYTDGAQCSGAFNCQCGRDFTGLTPSAIGFDQGGVYEGSWRKTERDVGRFAGRGAVTLVFAVQDLGDSLFDTAVLIDEVSVR